MYDPSVGRWLSEDPLEFEGGDVNLDRYVGNDPTNAIDPSGLFEEKATLFPNRETDERKKLDLEIADTKVGKDALEKQVFLVKTRKDLTDNFEPGVPFKYVIVDGKVVAIKHGKDAKAPHSYGTLKVKGKVGQPVEAAGMAAYYNGEKGEFLGIRFDLQTGHYKIRRQSNWMVGRDQALEAFKKVKGPDGKDGGLPARYKDMVKADP